ncbi:MAG TPA: PPA1309 family protein [Ornithinibacter sp.]|nr:PPA1309 family protein [Ornithinibacter sp.]
MTDAPQPVTDPLTLAALDTERHVARAGWDQPVRLFALVPTAELLAHEPQLAGGLAAHDAVAGALSAVEQEELPEAAGLEELLARIAWPDQVAGCAVAVERIVVPPDAERDLPEDADAALRAVADHPDRADVRLLVAVTRDGSSRCLLRQRAHDSDDRVALGEDIAPGLVHALRATFSPF